MKIYDREDRLILDVAVGDNSYRNRAIMGEHELTLYYSLAQHTELPVGAYCEFEGERYTLMRPEQFKMHHSRNFEYTVTFQSEQDKAKIWKFRNPVDGRLKFPYTAKPKEHLQMFVDNMNRREPGWTVGDCVEDTEHLIKYDHNYCWDALAMMAETFETEFEIVGKRVSLHKVEYDKSDPLPLAYGKGKGFKPGVGRSNSSDTPPVEILYVQGGDRNIDRSKYGDLFGFTDKPGELRLPQNATLGYDGEHFEDEEGFSKANARYYQADDQGLSIRNIGRTPTSLAEDSLDRSEDYPKRVGKVHKVFCVDEGRNLWNIVDYDIPESLDYTDYLIGEEGMTIIFQSGMLAGREFDVKYRHGVIGKKEPRRFEIVPQEIDGIMMPGGDFVPHGDGSDNSDTYAIFNVMLPKEYICDNDTKNGAAWDMFRNAIKYLFDNEEEKLTFTGELDGIWAKKDWANLSGKIRLGRFVRFTDAQFEREGVLVRIIGIKDYVNNPHSPKIELSNETTSTSVGSTLNTLAAQEVAIEENHKAALQYTKRRYRDAKETMEMIEAALSDNFSNRINPIAVETMQMLVGDERLQFAFVDAPGSMVAQPHGIIWDASEKRLKCPVATIQHHTIGIDTLKPSHNPGEYSYWQLPAKDSEVMDDGAQKWYLYIKAQKYEGLSAGAAEWRFETSSHKFEEGNYYWLLVGILNSEYDGERSFVTLYGFTEILPGRITTDRIANSEGDCYFDMLHAALRLRDKLAYNINGDGELRLKGVLVQSTSGDENVLGCYRGLWNSQYTYFKGDEVTYAPAANMPVSTYRFIYETPLRGVPPLDTNVWQVIAAGVKGEQGTPGISPNTSYKSTVFLRTNRTPETPTGGSYETPVPEGWSDGIPDGEQTLWASTRIFSSDGQDPQQPGWTAPQRLTDTAAFDVEYSSEENPASPTGHPNTNPQWSNTATQDTIWMATSRKSNGVWEDWQVSRIKGENGEDGSSIHIKGSARGHFKTLSEWEAYVDANNVRGGTWLIDRTTDAIAESTRFCQIKVWGAPKPGWTQGWMWGTDGVEGDAYLIENADHTDHGCLYVADGNQWSNAGHIKGADGTPGADGKNAYVHIKYATSTAKNSWTANNGETPGPYIGIYTDNSPADSMTWEDYAWRKWQGEDGWGYEYIYTRTTDETAPRIPLIADVYGKQDGYVPSGWTDNPTGVDADYPYEWVAFRKKTDGTWGSFTGSSANPRQAALWAKYGQDGEPGQDGADGNYTELRFYKSSNSTSLYLSSAAKYSPTPTGWSTTMPTIPKGYYLWMIQAVKSGSGSLLTPWSDPVRLTARDGDPGADGKNGPAMTYQGDWLSTKKYIGNEYRVDCVRHNGKFYVAKVDAGEFSGNTYIPTSADDGNKWNPFGSSFESVATELLLAENASIGDWIIQRGRIVSQKGRVNGTPSMAYENGSFIPDVLLNSLEAFLTFGGDMRLDANGLTLNSEGYSKLRILNSTIGNFTERALKKNDTENLYGTIGCDRTYHPSSNQTRTPFFKNTLTWDLGFFDKNSTIKINSARASFTVPTLENDGDVHASSGRLIKLELLKGNTVVKTIAIGSFGGKSQNTYVSQEMSGTYTYSVGETGEGNYSLRASGDDLRLDCAKSGETRTFDISVSANITYTRANYERTTLAKDGMMSAWGNGAFWMNEDACVMTMGNFGIKITASGMYLKKGTSSWSKWNP